MKGIKIFISAMKKDCSENSLHLLETFKSKLTFL